MSEQTLSSAETEPAKRRFSWGRFVLWCFGGLIVLGISLIGFDRTRSSRNLRTTVENLDETDPGWQLEEIEAARISLPDDKNSALLCRELARLLGSGWPTPAFEESMEIISLAELLDERQMALLEAEMKRLSPIRLAARPLADMPRGKFDIAYAFNPYLTLLPDVQHTREVAIFFRYEMLYLANKGDVTGAVRSGRACVCAGRAMYDDPFMISQFVHIAIISIGLHGVERALSLGESDEAELIALDKLLADEEKHPTFLIAMRGERAMMHQFFSRINSGAITTASMSKEMNMVEEPIVERIAGSFRQLGRNQQPQMMDLMNRLVENARLPLAEQIAGEKALDLEFRSQRFSHPLAPMFWPESGKIAQACRRKSALVAAMRGLIAVERYRMKNGKWPAKLVDVVPAFLERLPTDPFDGKPIRMAKVADGVIVYSVGVDGVDDGGKLDRKKPTAPGVDLGFQLWDNGKRAQPTSSEPKEKQP